MLLSADTEFVNTVQNDTRHFTPSSVSARTLQRTLLQWRTLFLPILTKLGMCRQILVKIPSIQFHDNAFGLTSSAEHWRTDMTTLTVLFPMSFARRRLTVQLQFPTADLAEDKAVIKITKLSYQCVRWPRLSQRSARVEVHFVTRILILNK